MNSPEDVPQPQTHNGHHDNTDCNNSHAHLHLTPQKHGPAHTALSSLILRLTTISHALHDQQDYGTTRASRPRYSPRYCAVLIAQRAPVRAALSGRCSQHTAKFPSARSGFVKHGGSPDVSSAAQQSARLWGGRLCWMAPAGRLAFFWR